MKKVYDFKRALAAEEFSPDAEDQNIMTFSCASSAPYLRHDRKGKGFVEILEISEDAINFERLVDGNAPFLYEHSTDQQIGVVEKAFIQNGKLMVTVRFSKNPFAQEVLQDIKDSIRRRNLNWLLRG